MEAIPGRVPARRGPEIRGLAARRAGRHGRRGFAGGQAVRPCFRQDLLPALLLAAGWRVAAAPLCSEPARRLIPHAKKQTSGVPGWGAAAARLLACVEEWACFLALLGLSAAEKGREGTASAAEAGGIRACRVGQFPRRPICRVGRFPCRVGQFPVAQRGHSFADMRSPCRRTRARTWRRPPSSTSSPSPAPPPLPSPWRTGGAPRRVAHRLFRHEQELRHGGPARPAPATRHAGDGR